MLVVMLGAAHWLRQQLAAMLIPLVSGRPGVRWKTPAGSAPLRQTRRTAVSAQAPGGALLHPHLCLLLGARAATALCSVRTFHRHRAVGDERLSWN